MINPNSKKKNNAGIYGKEAYEASVGVRSLMRAGKNPQLKGTVHEIMFCDKFNANPMNIFKGRSAHLTNSTTAEMKDVVIMAKGKVVGHAQLKDCVSDGGVAKTAKQINSGHYNKTKIYGTKETAKKLAGKTKQKVHSSGISSETTKRVADKALGNMPTLSALGSVAKCGGVSGAITSAGIETVSSVYGVFTGEKEIDEAAADIGYAAVKGGVTGAVSAAAGSVAAGATGAATSALASTAFGTVVAGTAGGAAVIAAAPVVAAFGVACGIGYAISSIFDW